MIQEGHRFSPSAMLMGGFLIVIGVFGVCLSLFHAKPFTFDLLITLLAGILVLFFGWFIPTFMLRNGLEHAVANTPLDQRNKRYFQMKHELRWGKMYEKYKEPSCLCGWTAMIMFLLTAVFPYGGISVEHFSSMYREGNLLPIIWITIGSSGTLLLACHWLRLGSKAAIMKEKGDKVRKKRIGEDAFMEERALG